MEVVAGIIDQCGSESDVKWQGEHDKRDHNPKVAMVTTSDDGDDKWRCFIEEAGSLLSPPPQ